MSEKLSLSLLLLKDTVLRRKHAVSQHNKDNDLFLKLSDMTVILMSCQVEVNQICK